MHILMIMFLQIIVNETAITFDLSIYQFLCGELEDQ